MLALGIGIIFGMNAARVSQVARYGLDLVHECVFMSPLEVILVAEEDWN